MEDVMGGPLVLCLVIGPFACFVAVVPVGILRCVGRPLLQRGRLFLYLPMCPLRSGLVLGIL
jgi:hypothetical protein